MRDGGSSASQDQAALSHLSAAEEIARDERLLDTLSPARPIPTRWYVVRDRAVVVGLAQRARVDSLLDQPRIARAGMSIVARQAGGGLVLVDDGMLCLTVALANDHPLYEADLTASYRWLGEACAAGLQALGIAARTIDVAEARARAATMAALARSLCFVGWSPHEVIVGDKKIVGLAQVRRQHGCLFQAGILLRDQSALADALCVACESDREDARRLLGRTTIGLGAAAGREVTVQEALDCLQRAIGEPLAHRTGGKP